MKQQKNRIHSGPKPDYYHKVKNIYYYNLISAVFF